MIMKRYFDSAYDFYLIIPHLGLTSEIKVLVFVGVEKQKKQFFYLNRVFINYIQFETLRNRKGVYFFFSYSNFYKLKKN